MNRHMHGRSTRLSLGAAILIAAAVVTVQPMPDAQVLSSAGAVTLSLPSATAGAIREAGTRGVAWDLIRGNGLTLFVKMKEVFSVSVTALAVEQGRVVRRWSSPSRVSVSAGSETVTLSGREYVPDDRFLLGSPRIPAVVGDQAGTTITIADAMRAIDAGAVSSFLDRTTATTASGVILIAMPAMSATSREAASSTTTPRFLRTGSF